ncbi:radical SAM protein [bacterium]|nr:radical SAM protein [bacterium]
MIGKIRRFLSPAAKEKILNSLPYKFLTRIRLHRHEIRFSCELTTRCNAKCDICTRDSLIKKGQLYVGDMGKDLIKRVMEEIKKFHNDGRRIYFVPMGLGEPLLYKGLFDLFQDIKYISKKIGIVLVTNGLSLDDRCCKELISLGIDEVTVSLNAINASSYQQHMGVDGYDKVCHNIENLINLRNKSGKKLPNVFVQYIDYDNNQKLFQKAVKRWSNIMRYNDKCYVHPIMNQANFFLGECTSKYSDVRYPCTQPLWRIAIKVNGDIYPCDPSFYSGNQKITFLYLGNIINKSPFDILMNKKSKPFKILESMRKDDYSQIPECAKCNTYKLECNSYFELPRPLRTKECKWL